MQVFTTFTHSSEVQTSKSRVLAAERVGDEDLIEVFVCLVTCAGATFVKGTRGNVSFLSCFGLCCCHEGSFSFGFGFSATHAWSLDWVRYFVLRQIFVGHMCAWGTYYTSRDLTPYCDQT